VLNAYEAKKIVTACPHCFNTLKNEYPVGGKYEVVHHTEFLKSLLDDGRLTIEVDNLKANGLHFTIRVI
jgi:Fe-S oxidoreductase